MTINFIPSILFNNDILRQTNKNKMEITIPYSLLILEAGIAGVRYEIFPFLLKEVKTQKELNDFGDNMMDVIRDRYINPICGSVLWSIYKYMCKKDIKLFLLCANTKEKQEVVKMWIKDNF
jgi:hypothetical protein